jgi:hypothetical protein
MTDTYIPGDEVIWTGLSHRFKRPVRIVETRWSYLTIFGETIADARLAYDIHDPVIGGTVYGIPADQLQKAVSDGQ